NFGVWAAKARMPTFTHDLAITDHHRADHGIRFDETFPLGSQFESSSHPALFHSTPLLHVNRRQESTVSTVRMRKVPPWAGPESRAPNWPRFPPRRWDCQVVSALPPAGRQ